MATISDTIFKPDGTPLTSQTVVFQTYGGPWFRAPGVTSTGRVVTTTHATTGAINVTLQRGQYSVQWRSSPAMGAQFAYKLVNVPVGNNTYRLSELEVSTGGESMAAGWPVYYEWTDIAENSIPDNEVIAVDRDINGRPGFFRRNDAYTVMIEGADGVTDIDGRIFKRQTYE